MNAEYSVEEVRARFEAWYPGSGIEDGDTSAKVAARFGYQAAYADLRERIKADDELCSPTLTECPRCKNDHAAALADPKCTMTHPPAQAAQGEAVWLERLKDPATVHVLMLRGVIAVPSIRSMVHLRGEVPNGDEVQLLRIAELQEQIAAHLAQPRAVPAERRVVVDSALIPRHYASNIGYAACMMESSQSVLDRREAPILRKIAALLAAAPSPGESE